MKAYLIFVAALMLASVFLELRMTEHHRPSMAVLASTSMSEGRLSFVSQRHVAGLIPTLNGVSLECHLYFGGSAGQCPRDVAGLAPGTEVTVAIAHVDSTYSERSVPMSIAVKGVQVYRVTPEQVIQDYERRSRRALLLYPFMLLAMMVISPLANDHFRDAFLRVFGF